MPKITRQACDQLRRELGLAASPEAVAARLGVTPMTVLKRYTKHERRVWAARIASSGLAGPECRGGAAPNRWGKPDRPPATHSWLDAAPGSDKVAPPCRSRPWPHRPPRFPVSNG